MASVQKMDGVAPSGRSCHKFATGRHLPEKKISFFEAVHSTVASSYRHCTRRAPDAYFGKNKKMDTAVAATAPSGPIKLLLFTDGACRGNPGPAGIGVVVKDPSSANGAKRKKPVVAQFARKVG